MGNSNPISFPVGAIAALIVTGILIWIRDLKWMSSWQEALPILVALPLGFWVGVPWAWNTTERMSISSISVGCFLVVTGVALDSTFVIALGWSWCLRTVLLRCVDSSERFKVNRLFLFGVLSFPWILMDSLAVGYWFRLSGASVCEDVFQTIGLNVRREGTYLWIQEIPFSVEAACSGLNALQGLLIAENGISCIHK